MHGTSISESNPDETRLAFLVVRLATMLEVTQLKTVLGWASLPPDWRPVFETHLHWAEAAKRGIVDEGDQP